MKAKFKQYRRKQIAELRPVTEQDIINYHNGNFITDCEYPKAISISEADIINGSPVIGDMIARNPKNHSDQWLVAKQYFEDNFEELNSKL